jgi:ureidoacrylate peracid hydrolase
MTAGMAIDWARTGLLLVDLQNDFLDPNGAYGRAGQSAPEIAALPDRLAPLVRAVRRQGGWIVSTQFTLVPGKGGEPFVSPHLKAMRPFLGKGDFAPGSWGQRLVDALAPADLSVEKVAFSAFYMTRLEWVLRKAGIERLVVAGIVTNGGVASTVRDAHVRDFEVTVLEDGCAAFSRQTHETAVAALAGIARIATVEEVLAEAGGKVGLGGGMGSGGAGGGAARAGR